MRWLRRHRGAVTLLLCLTFGSTLLLQLGSARMQPAEIDRLRLRADGAQGGVALARLRKAAERGNIDAQRATASVLLARADAISIHQGLHFAETAALRGDRAAQYLLGKALFEGTTVQRVDRTQARLWLQKSAAQDHPQAAYLLGLMYKNGYGVVVDQVVANGWFARAVVLGNPDAMFMLGNAYLEGVGVAQDQAHALRLYRAAAALEQPLAAQMLGYALRDGALGLAADPEQSREMMVEVEHALHHPRAVL